MQAIFRAADYPVNGNGLWKTLGDFEGRVIRAEASRFLGDWSYARTGLVLTRGGDSPQYRCFVFGQLDGQLLRTSTPRATIVEKQRRIGGGNCEC